MRAVSIMSSGCNAREEKTHGGEAVGGSDGGTTVLGDDGGSEEREDSGGVEHCCWW